MAATLATGLRVELQEIMDIKIKAMLLDFEVCLAKAVNEGQVVSSQPAQSSLSQASPSSKDNLLSPEVATGANGSEIAAAQDARYLVLPPGAARVELPQRLSARGTPRSARDIAYAPGSDAAYQPLSADDDQLLDGGHEVVDSRDQLYCLNSVTIILLLVNAAVDIAEVGCLTRQNTDTLATWYKAMQLALNFAFLVEICCRVSVLGEAFFHAKRNFGHIALLVTQVVEVVLILREWCFGLPMPESMNIPWYFRMCGILRILRVFNILDQLDYSNELHLLLASMQGSLRSLSWSALFIIVPMYVFGMALTQLVAEFRISEEVDEDQLEHMLHFFGSIERSMLTLFWAIAGGLSWAEATQPLTNFGFVLTEYAFVFYVASMSFAVLNVLTGVFVNSATTAANSEKDRKMLRALRKIFLEVDYDDSGNLTQREFQALLLHKDIEVCLKNLDIPPSQANHLFHLMDNDGSGVVEIDEFLKGCEMLQGSLKAIDFATYLHVFEDFKAEVSVFMKHVGEHTGQVVQPKESARAHVSTLPAYKR